MTWKGKPMPSKSSCQVLIVGAGVTGLSCAFHLKKQGIKSVAVAPSGPSLQAAETAAGMTCGGQLDNFTRVSHAHGDDFAAQLWHMGDAGFSSLVEFCQKQKVSIDCGDRLRLLVSEAEVTEAEKAVTALRPHNPGVKLVNPQTDPRWRNVFSPRVLSIQDEGHTGAVLDAQSLLRALEQNSDYRLIAELQQMESSSSGIVAATKNGDTYHAEIVILACHLDIRLYVPALRDALVSVADQWGKATLSQPLAQGLRSGTYWSANHTYEWGGLCREPGRMIIGGGRYLRPMAGIEAETATYEEKIASHLETQLQKTFSGIDTLQTERGSSGLDCRPCDELPIIGPMFGDQRMLVATGFMGSGLSMGFMAGACLAELIVQGKSPALPRRLWPERLRSMESKL